MVMKMNRTEFIGINLYYSQDFVDYIRKEIERLNNNIKDAKIKLYELNYKLKEIHNIPFDISEIFEIIDLLDKVEK